MRLPGTGHDCGPLLELGSIRRHLRLAMPVTRGVETIDVASIIGTVSRGRDFDGCWHPREPALAKRIDDIARAHPTGLDEPIEVVRLDRAHFVTDGHKRVALARRTGREMIDARVSEQPSPYRVEVDVDEEAIVRTARESEFRTHSGLARAIPQARFALTDPGDYGELLHAVLAHAHGLSERSERVVPLAEAAVDWHANDYVPTVADARERIGRYLDACTDADAYLTVHRQRTAYWGTDCTDPQCAANQVLAARRRRRLWGRSPVRLHLRRRPTSPDDLLLPLAEADGEGN